MEKLYKLQVFPSYEVSADVKKFKRMLFNRIGEYRYYNSLPHITLLRFVSGSRWEHEIVRAIQGAAEGFSKHHVTLKGVSYFHESGTLYLRILNPEYLQNLSRFIHRYVRQQASRMRIPLFDLRLSADLHLTVGSGLSSQNLAEGFDLLTKQQYERTFEVSRVKLLSISAEKAVNELVSEFDLNGSGPARSGSFERGALANFFDVESGNQLSLFQP